jgi:pimeloyl-ACP methyl ester carboxylesterase
MGEAGAGGVDARGSEARAARGGRGRRVIVAAAVLVIVYGALLLLARGAYPSLLYPAPPFAGALTPPPGGALWKLAAEDGAPVHALYLPRPQGPASGPTIVHFHGNGETIADSLDVAADLAARGLGVLLVEYRGYGLSRGGPAAASPTERGLYMDAAAALDALAREGVPPSSTVLWGTSLGTGVAAEMAARGRGAALILVAPYTSIRAVASRLAPIFPASLYMADRFDTLGKAPGVRVPTLIVHGDQDELIPHAMGREVAGAIAGARLVTIEGGRHNDLFVAAGARILDEIVTHSVRNAR